MISQKCKPIVNSGLMAYLAIDDALESIHEENYKEAYNASGNAIGHFLMLFTTKHITEQELNKSTAPLIEAKRAYERGDKDRMFDSIIRAAIDTEDFIFQKVVECECGKESR